MHEVHIKAQIPAAVWEKNLRSSPDSRGGGGGRESGGNRAKVEEPADWVQ